MHHRVNPMVVASLPFAIPSSCCLLILSHLAACISYTATGTSSALSFNMSQKAFTHLKFEYSSTPENMPHYPHIKEVDNVSGRISEYEHLILADYCRAHTIILQTTDSLFKATRIQQIRRLGQCVGFSGVTEEIWSDNIFHQWPYFSVRM